LRTGGARGCEEVVAGGERRAALDGEHRPNRSTDHERAFDPRASRPLGTGRFCDSIADWANCRFLRATRPSSLFSREIGPKSWIASSYLPWGRPGGVSCLSCAIPRLRTVVYSGICLCRHVRPIQLAPPLVRPDSSCVAFHARSTGSVMRVAHTISGRSRLNHNPWRPQWCKDNIRHEHV
jgi:hypothetical protein